MPISAQHAKDLANLRTFAKALHDDLRTTDRDDKTVKAFLHGIDNDFARLRVIVEGDPLPKPVG